MIAIAAIVLLGLWIAAAVAAFHAYVTRDSNNPQ